MTEPQATTPATPDPSTAGQPSQDAALQQALIEQAIAEQQEEEARQQGTPTPQGTPSAGGAPMSREDALRAAALQQAADEQRQEEAQGAASQAAPAAASPMPAGWDAQAPQLQGGPNLNPQDLGTTYRPGTKYMTGDLNVPTGDGSSPDKPLYHQDTILPASPDDSIAEATGKTLFHGLDAAGTGGAQTFFEAGDTIHDFLYGHTDTWDKKTDLRRMMEAGNQSDVDQTGVVGGFISGTSQFATGMIGLGKLTEGMKVLPWIGKGIAAAEDYIAGSKVAEKTALATKAAVVNWGAFDPHQQGLSNLLVQYPMFNNTVTQMLAHKPGDTDAEGRLKNVIENLGIEAASGALFMGSIKLYKALASGDRPAIAAATAEVQAAQRSVSEGGGANASEREASTDVATGTTQADVAANAQPSVPDPAAAGSPAAVSTDAPASPGAPAAPAVEQGAALHADGPVTAATPAPGGAAVPPAKPRFSVSFDGDGKPTFTPKQYLDAAQGKAPPEPLTTPATTTGDPVTTAPQVPGGEAQPNAAKGDGVQSSAPKFDPETTQSLITALQHDWDATKGKGVDWENAVASGERFAAPPNSLPYNKMANPADMEDFIHQAAESLNASGWLDEAKGGAVLTDEALRRRVNEYAAAFNADPAKIMGELSNAGEAARDMAAHMEVGYQIANKAFQDAYVTGRAIVEGRLDQWGGDAAQAIETAQAQLTQAAQAMAHANSIRSAGGRIVRRNRAEFMPSQADIDALRSANPDMLAQLLVSSRGDVKNLRTIIQPSTLSKLTNFANYIYVNNLLWGWKTHVNNIVSNTVTALLRPAERIVGSFAMGDAGTSIRQQAVQQYAYMAASIPDAWSAAVESFKLGDSKVGMYNADRYAAPLQGDRQLYRWNPVKNVATLAYNGLAAVSNMGQVALGFPTRFLAASDEASKVITYRSIVGARAHVEATQMGLQGDDLRSFVNERLDKAFDDQGHATDMAAKREAQIATFSNDLDTGVFAAGARAVQSFTNQFPAFKVLVPFIKTPTNIMRYGINLTPGLNALSSNFRDAWWAKVGDTPQIRMMNAAQARGQMGMGMLFTSTVGLMAYNGMITGGGPSDPKARRDLMATGWQPYSIRKTNADGSITYVKVDDALGPYAVPFTIVADIAEAMQHPEGANGHEAAANGLFLALAKNIADKTYLSGLAQAVDLVADPDPNRWQRVAGGTAANFIPASSLLRSANTTFGDDTMRDARTITDKLLSTIPGFSTTLPPRRDAWGDPIHSKLAWFSTVNGVVDHEMERLTMDTEDGRSIAGVTATRNGVDLRQVVMADGRQAYDRLQELSGHLPHGPALKGLVAKIMQTPAYAHAPDGSATGKGTKLWMLGTVINKYHDAAFKALKADPNVRKALYDHNEAARGATALKQRDPNGTIPQTQQLNKVLTGMGLPEVNTGPVTAPPAPGSQK